MHSSNWIGSFDRLVLNLDNGAVRRAADELELHGQSQVFPRANIQDDVIWHLALSLFRDMGNDPLACSLYAESIANLLALRLLRHHTGSEGPPILHDAPFTRSQMSVLNEHLLANLDARLTVGKLAACMALGPLQFSRRLKISTGMSAYDYITNVKVGRACELLATTRRPIAEIAVEVGFSSQSHFSARFRQIVGTTPLAYRQTSRLI
jgi:AraC family transcriptional regulator